MAPLLALFEDEWSILLRCFEKLLIYGSASVSLRKPILFGCMFVLLRSASKNLNFLSKRFVAPTVTKP